MLKNICNHFRSVKFVIFFWLLLEIEHFVTYSVYKTFWIKLSHVF